MILILKWGNLCRFHGYIFGFVNGVTSAFSGVVFIIVCEKVFSGISEAPLIF